MLGTCRHDPKNQELPLRAQEDSGTPPRRYQRDEVDSGCRSLGISPQPHPYGHYGEDDDCLLAPTAAQKFATRHIATKAAVPPRLPPAVTKIYRVYSLCEQPLR